MLVSHGEIIISCCWAHAKSSKSVSELSQTTLGTKTDLTHSMPSAVSVFGAI